MAGFHCEANNAVLSMQMILTQNFSLYMLLVVAFPSKELVDFLYLANESFDNGQWKLMKKD